MQEHEQQVEDLNDAGLEDGAADVDAGGGDDQAAHQSEAEARAREMGWDPAKGPLTAEQFIERGEKILPIKLRNVERENERLRDQMARFQQMQDTVLQRMQAQHEAELQAIQARQLQAVENGDREAYEALRKREDALRASPPTAQPQQQPAQPEMPRETQEFLAEHSWLTEDPVAMAAAKAAAEVALRNGVTDVRGQLDAARRELQMIRPARFQPPARPPAVEGGGGRPVKRGKGFADLPADAKQAFERLVARGAYSKTEAAQYAADYFSQKGA